MEIEAKPIRKTLNVLALPCLALLAIAAVKNATLSLEDSIDTLYLREKDNANGGGTYCNDFDIAGDSNCTSIPSFKGKENQKFGKVMDAGTVSSYDDRITYKSNWAPWQAPITETYEKRIFKTYRFSYYVSVPINEKDCFYLDPGISNSFTIAHSTSSSETASEMIERTYSVTETVSEKIGLEIGFSIPLGDIEAGGKLSSETNIAVSTTLSNTVRRENSKTITYSEQQSSIWNLANTSNERMFYKFHYRKKFKLYFTCQYYCNYSCTRTGVNTFGLDDQYSYSFVNYTPEKTVFFLVPVDNSMYFGYDEYYNNAQGDEEIVKSFENNVVYL